MCNVKRFPDGLLFNCQVESESDCLPSTTLPFRQPGYSHDLDLDGQGDHDTPLFKLFLRPEIPICQLLDSECTYIGQAIFQFSANSVGENRVFCIFCVFLHIFTQPCQIWLFSHVFCLFLPPKMIINKDHQHYRGY